MSGRRVLCAAGVLAVSLLTLLGACDDAATAPADAGDGPRRDLSRVEAGTLDGRAGDGLAGGDASGARCPSYDPPQIAGTVSAPAIDEVSGMVASRRQSGVLWVHNDSGDSARVFALDTQGQLLGTFNLGGAGARDWEDIALGPGPQPGLDYLYLGDIGDNAQLRAGVVVYRVPEPSVPAGGGTHDVSGVETLRLKYPDRAHNAETLLIDPRQGDLYIITKSDDAVSLIFRAKAPLGEGAERTLEQVGTLRFRAGLLANVGSGLATGGDLAPDGSGLLLRTYKDVLYWPIAPAQDLAAALATAPCALPQANEGQGEAVAFGGSGDYFTLSEGRDQPLYRFRVR